MRSTSLLTVFVVAMSLTVTAAGENKYSFWVERCAWRASHVVVATEGETIDGQVTVLESWKGDLKPSAILSVPELATFASEPARRIGPTYLSGTQRQDHPTHVSCSRMVLFLLRQATCGRMGEEPPATPWQPAAHLGGMPVSLAWIEDGNVYAVLQLSNPGPAEILPQHGSEAFLRVEALRIIGLRDAFDRAAALNDPRERAEALMPFARLRTACGAQEAAIQGLVGCGIPGQGYLMALFQDASLANSYHVMTQVVGETRREEAAVFLTRLLNADLRHLRKAVPCLEKTANPEQPLRNPAFPRFFDIYGRVKYAVYYLREMRYRPCREVVGKFLEFLQSTPELSAMDSKDLVRDCRAILDMPDAASPGKP